MVSAGVIDNKNKLIGMITADDIVTILKEETEEDTLRLAGVSEEDISDTAVEITKKRFIWLTLNLITAKKTIKTGGVFFIFHKKNKTNS